MKASSIAVLLLALPTPLLNVAASLAQEQLPAEDRACMIAAIGKLPKRAQGRGKPSGDVVPDIKGPQ
jgi:hypothetical protein